jgi:ABC-type dipeptide/oligopeptide/nickel transport system permease component
MALLTVWMLSSAVFLALRLLPGDPAALVLGDLASDEDRQALRARLHLDEPLGAQYARFVRGVITLDLGPSLRQPGVSALDRVREALPATAALAGVAVLLGALAGIGAGVLALGPWLGGARRHVNTLVVIVSATPLLAIGPVATYALAVRTRIVPLPGDPSSGAGGLLFAAVLLGIPLGAQVARVTRAALLDLGRSQFLEVARAKGAGPGRVWFLHALPAASAPVLAVVATQLGALLGGAVVLERLFERPGLGTLMLEAYASRDLPVLEAAIVASGGLFVGTQAAAAALHALVDPRVRGA